MPSADIEIGSPMDLCVLPQTGSGEPWLLVAIAAAVLVAAGIALALSGRARRSVLTGIGALAIVGALVVVGGVGGAAPAQADAGSADCVTAPMPASPAPSAATVVTPGIPTATTQCFVEPTVQIPTTQGVVYSQTRTDDTLTVTAAAAPGYALLAGAVTSWSFDLTQRLAAPAPIALPESTDTTPGFGGPTGTYLYPADEDLVPSIDAAAQEGLLTYAFDGSRWTVVVEIGAVVFETGEVVATRTVTAPVPSELSYDFEENAYVLVFSPEAVLAFNEQLQLAAQELGEQNPGTSVQQLGIDYPGLEVQVSYDAGSGCGIVTDVVAVDIVVSAPTAAARSGADAILPFGLAALPATESGAEPAAEQPSESPATGAAESDEPATPDADEVVEETAVVDER